MLKSSQTNPHKMKKNTILSLELERVQWKHFQLLLIID